MFAHNLERFYFFLFKPALAVARLSGVVIQLSELELLPLLVDRFAAA